MTRAPAGALAGVLLAAVLLTGCSGGDDEAPEPAPSSTAPSPRTPPPISPRETATLPPGSTLPETLPQTPAPSPSTGVPIPIPSDPQD